MNASLKNTIDRNLPTLLVGGVVICAIAWYLFAFVIPNHPARPRNVPNSATLVLQGWDHFWQECRFDSGEQQDMCRIYNGSGYLLRNEVFLPANGGKALPDDQLRVASGGDSHSVHLLNGTVLIPREHFDGIKKDLPYSLSGSK
jgi:hypothetical protein